MKLLSFIIGNTVYPGIEINNQLYSLAPHITAFDSDFFAKNGLERIRKIINAGKLIPVDEPYKITYPVNTPSKIICIGMNYKAHIDETQWKAPKYPILFLKSTTALCGPFDPIIIPQECKKVDWEVELAFVIGKTAQRVNQEHAMEYIAGYTILNDVSERMFQLERGSQWTQGKSFDHFAPTGPYLVTCDEITDPHNLQLWTKVNGEIMQHGNSRDLIFDIPYLVEYISHVMTLLPGDIISTGTPAGVAMGRSNQPYLQPGDIVEQGIDGLGTSRQECIALQL